MGEAWNYGKAWHYEIGTATLRAHRRSLDPRGPKASARVYIRETWL